MLQTASSEASLNNVFRYHIPAIFLTTEQGTGPTYVIAGSEDGKIYSWDLQTRKVVSELESHKGQSEIRDEALSLLTRVASSPNTEAVLCLAVSCLRLAIERIALTYSLYW